MGTRLIHIGLPMTLYEIAQRMNKRDSGGLAAVERMLTAAQETGLVSHDQLNLISESVGCSLRWPENE